MREDSARGLSSGRFLRIIRNGDRVSQPPPVIEVIGQPVHFLTIQQTTDCAFLDFDSSLGKHNPWHGSCQVCNSSGPTLRQQCLKKCVFDLV